MSLNKVLVKNKERILFFTIFVLAILLRTINLGSMPAGLYQDEATVAYNSWCLFHEGTDLSGNIHPMYFADWGDGHSALYCWLTQPVIAMSHGEINPLISRIPQALFGILTVLAVFSIGLVLFDLKAGLWFMFLLAINPWHVMLSRWGLDANLAPAFITFGLLFFALGMEKNRLFLLASALFYGISLYSYASIWPSVPVILLLQIIYGLSKHKLKIDLVSISAAVLLGLVALPCIIFALSNFGMVKIDTVYGLSIPKMTGYRGSDLDITLLTIINRIKGVAKMLLTGTDNSVYDVIEIWGFFYPIGLIFVVLGGIATVFEAIKKLIKKDSAPEVIILIQFIGAIPTCMLADPKVHRVNNIYIPLILMSGIGIMYILRVIPEKINKYAECILVMIFLACLCLFQKDYYTTYAKKANPYFGIGINESVSIALSQADAKGINTIECEKATQWPRLLLYTKTSAKTYLDTMVQDETYTDKTPKAFTTENGILVNTRLNYDDITSDKIYILYESERHYFEEGFNLIPGSDYWYVAVPK